MSKYLSIAVAVFFIFSQYSCKKDKVALECKLASWQYGSQSYFFTYNNAGFIERLSISGSSTYIVYTQSGNQLTRQGYDSTGAPVGSPAISYVNSSGYYSMVPGSSDTTFITYNADGQLLTYVRRNDTIVSQTSFTYENGDVVQAVSLKSDSSVNSITTYEYYTDRVNNSNLNISFDLLEPRYGKPNRHFVKRSTASNSSGDITYTSFYYTFDENGNATTAQLVFQPSNTINNLSFVYTCP